MKKLTASLVYLCVMSLLLVNLLYALFSAYPGYQKTERRSTLIASSPGSAKRISFIEDELFKKNRGFEKKDWRSH